MLAEILRKVYSQSCNAVLTLYGHQATVIDRVQVDGQFLYIDHRLWCNLDSGEYGDVVDLAVFLAGNDEASHVLFKAAGIPWCDNYEELITQRGCVQPRSAGLYLIVQLGEEPDLSGLKPHRLVGAIHRAVAIETGEVAPMDGIQRVLEPKGHGAGLVIEQGRSIVLS